MEGDVEYLQRPDRMFSIGSYVLRCNGCQDNGDHDLMRLSAMSEVALKTLFIVASLHCRAGRMLMCGWSMLCKWGYHVGPLPVTTGTIRQTKLQ
eukprot:1911161-Pleurochrysis_carterae.AAC.1